MAFPGNIMSLFSGVTAQPAAAVATTGNPTQVVNPGQPLPGTQASPATANNGVVPAGSSAAPTGEQSPLDAYAKIWETAAKPDDPNSGPMFANVSAAELMKSAGQVDFAKVITPETLQAITAGGEGAAKALATAMNSVAQTVFAQSAFATTKIVDQATAKMQERFDAQLPNLITKHSVNAGLADNNPLFSNPAVAPLVSALGEQFQRKNPNATPKEIQTQVGEYMTSIGMAFAPKVATTAAQKKAAKSEDWGVFFQET